MRAVGFVAGGCALLMTMVLLMVGGMVGASGTVSAYSDDSGCDVTMLGSDAVPPDLRSIFTTASNAYDLGSEGPAILAGLTKVESDFGRNMGPSSAGAEGWTQFMPATWQRYGVDADGDGKADPMDAADAITSTARYLKASGAPDDWHRALFAYNHADWYVREVLAAAKKLAAGSSTTTADLSGCGTVPVTTGPGGRLVGGGQIVPIPGQPGMRVDARILGDVELLVAQYHLQVTAGYATSGHEPGGEHPLGLAVDLVPGPGGSWDEVDVLAHWAEPTQNHPRAPFRWVGYDGDAGHGRGNHLHLSWMHGAAPDGPPAPWVDVLSGGDGS